MIPWKIKLTPEAHKILSKLHPEQKKLIKKALKELCDSPHRGSELQGELAGFKSFKPKRYRIIYRISVEKRNIEIYYIGHRRNIYEEFRKLLKLTKE